MSNQEKEREEQQQNHHKVLEPIVDVLNSFEELKRVLGVAKGASRERVVARAKTLMKERDEQRQQLKELANHAGFSEWRYLVQHFGYQPQGFLAGERGLGVELPECFKRPNEHWREPCRIYGKSHKAVNYRQDAHYLLLCQQFASRMIEQFPEHIDYITEHYETHHPEQFLEWCDENLTGRLEKREEERPNPTWASAFSSFVPDDLLTEEVRQALMAHAATMEFVPMGAKDRRTTDDDMVMEWRLAGADYQAAKVVERVLVSQQFAEQPMPFMDEEGHHTHWESIWNTLVDLENEPTAFIDALNTIGIDGVWAAWRTELEESDLDPSHITKPLGSEAALGMTGGVSAE